MTEGSNSSDHLHTRVRVQKTTTGRLLGVAVMIPAEIVGNFIKNDVEKIEIEIEAITEGILLKIAD